MTVRCPPKGHLIEAMANRTYVTWRIFLQELFDNAFGAGAKRVWIEFRRQGKDTYIVIRDDGDGTRDMVAFATLGLHKEHKKKDGISQYGIGFKDVTVWASKGEGTVTIVSVYKTDRIRRSITWNWKVYSENDWGLDDPTERPAKTEEVGTEIHLLGVTRIVPSGAEWEKIVADLGYCYRPCLRPGVDRGREIHIKARSSNSEWMLVKPWEPPPLEEGVCDTKITVNGKTAKVFVGVIKQGHSCDRRGITYFRHFRVVQTASANGCGRYSHVNICGFVELGEEWKLTTHKDAVVDGEKLFAEVARVAADVLARGETRASEMTSKHFFTALETKINATLAGVKRRAKRGPRKEGPRLPRKKPTRRGTKHSRAAEEQPGDAFLSRAASGVTIRYAPLGGDTIGNFVAPNVVTLDTDQPAVDAALKSGNGLAGAVLIASLLSSVEPNGPQQMMLFSVPALAEVEPAKRFGFLMATLLRDDLGLDGSQVVPSAVPQAAE